MTAGCPKCGGTMERGFATAAGLIGGDKIETRQPRLLFVVAGTPTSQNPIKAFQQGLSEEPSSRSYGIVGARCARCGFVEFYANGEPAA